MVIKRMPGTQHLAEVFVADVWQAKIFFDAENQSFNVIRGWLDFDHKAAVLAWIKEIGR